MAFGWPSVVLHILTFAAILCSASALVDYPAGCNAERYSSSAGPLLNDFPKTMLWGSATSATQVEGAAFDEGRTPSIWDVAAQDPGFIKDGSTPTIADDQYHKIQEDVKLLVDAGFNSYRFSISWSRVLPDGGRVVNNQGVAYYNALINGLKSAGIEPVATIFHWDLPEFLHESKGGWLNGTIVEDFAFYADLCFQTFGDRVKNWMTLNEPGQVSVQGYGMGSFAPRRCSDRTICKAGDSSIEPYLVAHNLLLSHSAAVKIYRTKYQGIQGGRIGIALDSQYLYPIDNDPVNVAAAQRGMEFSYGWFADPIATGDYPPSMRANVGSRLPVFTNDQSTQLKGSTDFFGINFYTASYAKQGEPSGAGTPWVDSDTLTSQTSFVTGQPIGPDTASPWLKVVPSGIKDMLEWISNRYNGAAIMVTENGSSDPNDPTIPLVQALCDEQRIQYYQQYLSNILEAVRAGVNLQGYFAWSLLDNWEWAQGYSQRFGLYFVDFTNSGRPRYPKASAAWFSDFFSSMSSV